LQIRRLMIKNFRGLRNATIQLPKHAVLIGDNNTGKTTILEAIDLVLGPDRLNRYPPIDEHDFFEGRYRPSLQADAKQNPVSEASTVPTDSDSSTPEPPPQIEIEATITDLSEEQRSRFGSYAEWWDKTTSHLYDDPDPAGVDAESISQALRVTFIGRYDPELDDFEGRTFFARSLTENETPDQFGARDKQVCGFLYLRSHRTGTRALSLERGSLLDIILRVKELRPQMWEATLASLASFTVAGDPKLGLSGILESINTSLKKYVPKEWGVHPHLKVSNLTRDHLRRVITAFIATGAGDHAAPFFRQGSGTINMLVLAMLSQIAEDKQNVIFAMEEPETAIPPYAQKRIVHEIRNLSAQAIFTSHSPYVLEEFGLEETVVLARTHDGSLSQSAIELPTNVKLKRYRQEFRTRFCEGLLARRILLAEGTTEAAAFPAVARRLSELRPAIYASLEGLGVCTIDAGGDTNIPPLAELYRNLNKRLFAVCDKQSDNNRAAIEAQVEALFMHSEPAFEDLVLKNTSADALARFSEIIVWPAHILDRYPDPKADLLGSMRMYFDWSKGRWGLADFLAQCSEDEIPSWIRETCASLKMLCDPPAGASNEPSPANPAADETAVTTNAAD
jgi:putative ATP-dependent endonuclease of OLD family